MPQISYSIQGRLWINSGETPLLGSGKLALICKIKNLKSLRKAAEEMGMSYRKAWYSINQINTLAASPVVILKRGGKNGGEAEITEYGERLIVFYHKLEQDLAEFIKDKSQALKTLDIA